MATVSFEKQVTAQPQGSPPRFARSRQMMDCLRQQWLYSEKRPRDIVFLALERLLPERPPLRQERQPPRQQRQPLRQQPQPMMLAQLTREAAALARDLSAQHDVAFDNWDSCARAVMKTLLLAEALRTPAGDVIVAGVSAPAALVGALQEDYRDAAEAFLLECIIRLLGDVTTRDHTALAHALFRQFDSRVPIEHLEDRLVILMARLADRLTLSGDVYIWQAPSLA